MKSERAADRESTATKADPKRTIQALDRLHILHSSELMNLENSLLSPWHSPRVSISLSAYRGHTRRFKADTAIFWRHKNMNEPTFTVRCMNQIPSEPPAWSQREPPKDRIQQRKQTQSGQYRPLTACTFSQFGAVGGRHRHPKSLETYDFEEKQAWKQSFKPLTFSEDKYITISLYLCNWLHKREI